MTPGEKFWQAVAEERPLQVVGTINAYSALLAKRAGFKAIYLSGAGVANASFGLPDLGVTTFTDVCEDVRRISSVCDLPMLVDADTGWGNASKIARSIRAIEKAGAAGVHLEDQVEAKRCGHRPGKQLVTSEEMCDRIKAAVDARRHDRFVIMARTDAHAVEGQSAAIERADTYIKAGADMIFSEALTSLEEFKEFTDAVSMPVLANITEFGKTPLLTLDQLNQAGVRMALYPLSAFRAMSMAAEKVYETVRKDGTQKSVLPIMQTREQLYDVLDYHEYERKLDELFAKEDD
ncbi:MAG: methylisocitrate lyase [Gammaproteobacteria bacterium]|nr:methylisocitrate lyase [Gammaproteobacteria bacterium]